MVRRTRFVPALEWFFVFFLAACGGGGDQPAVDEQADDATPAPFETTLVAEGVWQFRWQAHNALFIETPGGVIAVDPISTEAAEVFVEQIRTHVGSDAQLLAVVYSHRDADHAQGANVLREALGPDAPIVAHINALEPMTAAADPSLPPPTVTYESRTTIAEEFRPVELVHPGLSHSDDQSVILVPDVGVAFAVDFVAADRVGYRDLSTWHFPEQVDAINRLLEEDFTIIAFGHGPSGDRAAVERQAQYFQDLTNAVSAALDTGMSEDEAAETIDLSDYASWDRYDDWIELNIRGVYRHLAAKR